MKRAVSIVIDIGRNPVLLKTSEPLLIELLEERYAGFANPAISWVFEFDVVVVSPGFSGGSEEVRVRQQAGVWQMERGDFRAVYDPASRKGWVRQPWGPYAIDSVLRILHTLVLAPEGGFLLHSAGAVRNGRAFLFAGRSGAGKTTIARLAPSDVALLSDEISYVRRQPEGYFAFGTPFAGDLAKGGQNLSAPVAALFVLAQGPVNRMEPVSGPRAVRHLLENILFFAEEAEPVNQVFESACEFVGQVPVHQLTFAPDARVWELIA